MDVCCECCVLSSRGLCDELIPRPKESYRLWCVVVCDLENQTSWMRRPRPIRGVIALREKKMLQRVIIILNKFRNRNTWQSMDNRKSPILEKSATVITSLCYSYAARCPLLYTRRSGTFVYSLYPKITCHKFWKTNWTN